MQIGATQCICVCATEEHMGYSLTADVLSVGGKQDICPTMQQNVFRFPYSDFLAPHMSGSVKAIPSAPYQFFCCIAFVTASIKRCIRDIPNAACFIRKPREL